MKRFTPDVIAFKEQDKYKLGDDFTKIGILVAGIALGMIAGGLDMMKKSERGFADRANTGTVKALYDDLDSKAAKVGK